MKSEFEMNLMSELIFFLDLQIKQINEGIHMHQTKYDKELIKKFRIDNTKEIVIPMALKIKIDHETRC